MIDSSEVTVDLALPTTFGLALMVVVARHIGEEIHGPAEKLLAHGVDESYNWCLLGQFMELMGHLADTGGILFACLWQENHIARHVSGSLVVLAVRELPREIWDEESRVADQAGCVIEKLGSGEGLVTTLVSKNPDTGTEETLNNGVEGPKYSADCG